MAPSEAFIKNVDKAIHNERLQNALGELPQGLVAQRNAAIACLPDYEILREKAKAIRDHTLSHLDHYLELFAEKAEAAGAEVHWASDGLEACSIVENICLSKKASLVVKGKSMISEEINLNGRLKALGIEVLETDLGEYIVQKRGERPSHIIAPAIHLTQSEIESDFRLYHEDYLPGRVLNTPESLVQEARSILRRKFVSADIGITGANFLIAETGSAMIVTNEGNGDLCLALPPVHIVVTSLEKVVPTLKDAAILLRLLTRSATGQDISAYTTLTTGVRGDGDPNGPTQFHIILLDNGRTKMLKDDLREILRCIRCGACMNVCPVYNAIGGHAYGSVYSGPIGSVLTPSLFGITHSADLPAASTLCGRCEEVCPVKIPLPSLLRYWRGLTQKRIKTSLKNRFLYSIWAYCSQRPKLYHFMARCFSKILLYFEKRNILHRIPFAQGWQKYRKFPIPSGETFQELWKKKSSEEQA